MRASLKYLFLVVLLFSVSPYSWAKGGGKEILSQKDSIVSIVSSPSLTKTRTIPALEKRHSNWCPSPQKALLFALIPGGGQLYNRQYWKAPIVWTAFVGCSYLVSHNAVNYNNYYRAYSDLMGNAPLENTSWQAYIPAGSNPADYVGSSELQTRLKRGADSSRRTRDLCIIVTVLVYGLSLLDAYVDASMYDFDISPNLSMSVLPGMMPRAPLGNNIGYGLTCSFTIK